MVECFEAILETSGEGRLEFPQNVTFVLDYCFPLALNDVLFVDELESKVLGTPLVSNQKDQTETASTQATD